MVLGIYTYCNAFSLASYYVPTEYVLSFNCKMFVFMVLLEMRFGYDGDMVPRQFL